MKLQHRLILLPIIALLPALAVLVWNQVDLHQSRRHDLGQQVIALAKQQAAEVDRIAEGALQFLVALAQIPDIRSGSAECGPLLERIRTNYKSYLALIRADKNGAVTCSSIGPGPSIEDRLYFRRAVQTKNFSVGQYVDGRGTRAPTFHFSYPLLDDDGNVLGVIAAALDLEWFATRLAEKLPENSSLNVTDADGTMLVRLPNNERYRGEKIPVTRGIIYSAAPGVTEIGGLDGVRQILGYVPIPASAYGLYVGVAREIEPAFSDIRRSQYRGGLLVASGLLLSLALAMLWSEYGIRRPVDALLQNARRWSSGDYTPSGRHWDRSELGSIGNAFDDLVSAVSDREQRLRQSQKRLDEQQRHLASVLDQVPAGIMHTLPDKTYAFVNKAFCDLLGRRSDQLLGHSFTEFTHPEDIEADAHRFDEAIQHRQDYVHKKRYIKPDGTTVWAENTVTHLELGQGILAVCLDLAQRMRTEEMQNRLINELNHRVKNTLVQVQALITMASKFPGSKDQLIDTFVNRLKALATTHNLLTEGLWERTRLSDLIQAELQPYAKGNITIKGPPVYVSPRQAIDLGMVFHELATNALKYGCFGDDNGRLLISWVVDGDVLIISWKEGGCTNISEPSQKGFGSILIQQSIADLSGIVRKEFKPTGLECIIEIPVNGDQRTPTRIDQYELT